MTEPTGSAETASPSNKKSTRIEWNVRPATPDDAETVNEILWDSYSHLLKDNYDAELLDVALPLISKARPELLTCGTWYVVEHPISRDLVGCGGWTLDQPTTRNNGSSLLTPGKAGVPHLRHFATRQAWTRQGVGKAIWNQSWDAIRRRVGETELEVFSTLTAEPFYASVGFERIQEMTIPLVENCQFPCILMRRQSP